MKILIDLTSLADNFSGIERFAACLALEMINEGSNAFILVFKEAVHPLFTEHISNANVETVILSRCNKLIFNQIKLPWAISRIQADCYLFLAFPVPVLLFKRNMVSTIHDMCCWDCPETMNGMSSLYFKVSHRIAMWKCQAIITISAFSENRIVARFPSSREKLWRIYCGVESKFLQYHKDSKKANAVRTKYYLPENYILSLSTLEPRKNIRLLIEAYRELVLTEDFSMPLVLAGRKGWKMDDLLHGVESKVEKQILFTGFIDDEDLPAVYGGAKLFVFPSKYEGFGIPPLEALACGTPVLSSDAASLPEILGNAATYFESDNEQDLYKQLRKMFFQHVSTEDALAEVNRASKYIWNVQASVLLNKLLGMK